MDSPHAPLHRLRLRHWVAIDCAASVLLTFATSLNWGPLSLLRLHGPQGAGTILMVGALVAGLRQLWPRTVVSLLAVGWAVATALGDYPGSALPVAFAIYSIPLRLPHRDATRWLASALAVTVAGPLLHLISPHGSPYPGATALVRDGVLVALAWVVGFAVRQQRTYAAGLREQAEQKSREELAQFRRMVSEERLEIARELHDVMAHNMGLIAVQAGVANYVVAEHPDEAARALSSIEEISRGALREMRAMLGMLRSGNHSADSTDMAHELLPAPRLADLRNLADRTGAAGVHVTLDIQGRERPLPAGLDLAAYRVVQEAVTNVIKHASTDACRVTVTYEEDALMLDVTDAGRGADMSGEDPSIGHGIVGMRERVAMYGGQLRAESMPGGGFQVNARFPLGVDG